MKHKSTLKTVQPSSPLPFNEWAMYIKSELIKLKLKIVLNEN